MEFDSIGNKTRPRLTDINYLNQIKNSRVSDTIPVEPSLFDKIVSKMKTNITNFIESNIYIIVIIIFIIILLIYRYFQYKTIKKKINKTQLDDINKTYIEQIEHIDENMFDTSLINSDENYKINKNIINNSSYKPYNLKNMTEYHRL